MREEGYYWAKLGGRWLISYYSTPCYDGDALLWIVGDDNFVDGDFDEIDERRIVRGE